MGTKFEKMSWAQWIKPVIVATWEVDTQKITNPSQTTQKKFMRPPSQRKKAECGGACLSFQL
jgi:hypothetical protein